MADAARDAARRRGRRGGGNDRVMSEGDLDGLIWPRLFGTDDWHPAATDTEHGQAARGNVKGSPAHSLLAELAVTMALATAHGGGPRAAATLWDEVVEDIEFNYWQVLTLSVSPRRSCDFSFLSTSFFLLSAECPGKLCRTYTCFGSLT